MSESIDRPTRGGRSVTGLVFALVVLALAGPLAPPTAAQDAELRAQLTENFRLLPLRQGLVLQPVDSDLGISTIELAGDDLVVDGVSISLDELEARLGDRAAPFRQLLALDEADRAAWIGDASGTETETEAEAEAEAEVEPMPGEPAPTPAEDPGSEEAELEGENRSASERRDEVRRRIDRSRGRADTQVVVASPLRVESDEVSRDVVVLGGSLTVAGRVIGDAAAIGGSARVSGEIDGDLSVVGGSITLEDGARIRGDVVSVGGEVVREEDVEVDGQVLEVPLGPAVRIGDWDWDWDWDSDLKWHYDRPWFSFSPLGYMFGVGWEVFCLAVFALLACLVLLLAPGPVELVAQKAADEPWKSGLVGLLSQILFIPILVIVCLILAISVIGIPLLILVPFALFGLMLVAFLGYTAVALRVGRWFEDRFGWRLANGYMALLVGFAAIQGLSFIGELLDFGGGPLWLFSMMFGLLGALVCYVAWTVGFGAAVLTRFGTAPGWGDEGEWTPPADPPSYTDSAGWVSDGVPEEPQPPEPATAWEDDEVIGGERGGEETTDRD